MPETGPDASGGDPSAVRSPLHVKLVWLTFFRLLMITVLLGGTVGMTWDAPGDLARSTLPLYGIVAVTYVASLGFSLFLRAQRGLTGVAYAQMALDAVLASAVVALTGRSDSVFVFLFSLGIVNGSILLFRRGALTATALSLAGYGVVALLRGPPPGAVVAFAHAGAFVATAVLSSYLAELLRRSDERLGKREGDLAAMRVQHEAIVQSVSSGILTTDPRGRITFVNRAGERILGVAAKDLVGQPSERVAALAPGASREETEMVNARGERLHLGYASSQLIGPDGSEMGSALVFQDLTPLRKMEEAMRRSERLADLGQIAAGLAHELRNPLASMAGAIELIRTRQPSGSEDERLTSIVLREAARLDELVTRFLLYTRPTPLAAKEVDLGELLHETLRVFEHHPSAAGVSVEEEISPALAAGDPDQLRQVAWNLVINAAEAIAETRGDARTIRMGCGASPDGGAWFSISDTGPGIAAEDLKRLFTPFFTTKAEGTGLGLAIVHRIVDAHHGTVDVDTAASQGTTFRVRLPPAKPDTVPG